MNADTDTPLADSVFAVEKGDTVHVATDDYEWQSPMEVQEVEDTKWDNPVGEPWKTRTVVLEGGYSNEFTFQAAEDDSDIELRSNGRSRGIITEFSPVDEQPEEEFECPNCDDTFESEHGRNVHQGQVHGSDDDDDASTGEEDAEDLDAVNVEAPEDDENSSDNTDVALPEGVSEEDIREACREYEQLGAVAEVLEVPTDRVRTLTVALDCYELISDVTGTRYGGVGDAK